MALKEKESARKAAYMYPSGRDIPVVYQAAGSDGFNHAGYRTRGLYGNRGKERI